jgi:predicted PilT family ATPase
MGDIVMSELDLRKIADELFVEAKSGDEMFLEIDKQYSKVLQL